MAVFCTRCGSRLDGRTGLCPRCDSGAVPQFRHPSAGGAVPGDWSAGGGEAEKKAAKQAEKARRAGEKRAEKARRAGEKQAEKARRRAERKAAKQAEKARRRAEKKAAKKARRAAMTVGQKIAGVLLRLVLFLLILALLGAAAAAALTYFRVVEIPLAADVMERLGVEPVDSGGEAAFYTLSEPFSPVRVTDEESAVLAARDAVRALGLGHAADDVTVTNVARFEEASYYRMQQNCGGVPVYGCTMTVIADAEGNAVGFTSNAVDIRGLQFDSAASQDTLNEKAQAYFAEEGWTGTITVDPPAEEDRIIFLLDGRPVPAYHVTVLEDGKAVPFIDVIIRADTGEILEAENTRFEEAASCYDDQRRFEVEGFLDRAGDSPQYQLYDSGRGYRVYSYQYTDSSTDERDRIYIVSANELFGDTEEEQNLEQEKGVELLYYLTRIRDFFVLYCGDSGFPEMNLYYDDMYSNGRNAYFSWKDASDHKLPCISVGSETGVDNLDDIAHEYMHSISNRIVKWKGRTVTNPKSDEPGAVNEAYSDVFAELAVHYLTGREPDWVHSSRILHDPMSNGHPAAVGDKQIFRYEDGDGKPILDRNRKEQWVISVDTDIGLDDFCHGFSTIVSHCAYLMTIGVDGSYERLSLSRLTNLWYRTLYALPSNCTFTALRENMELTAALNGFTEEEQACIAAAFDAVGIAGAEDPEDPDATFKKKIKLTVYDRGGSPYDDYTITVTGTEYSGWLHLGLFTKDYSKTYRVTSKTPKSLNLPIGDYTVSVTDNFNETLTEQTDIQVRTLADRDELYMDTRFGFDYLLRPDTKIQVYDMNRAPYDNYTIQIDGVQDDGGTYTNRIRVTDSRETVPRLPAGKYSLLFIDENDTSRTKTVTARVLATGSPVLRVQTNFGVQAGTFAPADVPPDAVEFNGHYYYIFTDERSWQAAYDTCTERNGYLVTITSQEEQDFLTDYINRTAQTYGTRREDGTVDPWRKNLWIGASDYAAEQTWVWKNGEAFEYENWGWPQPDDAGGQDFGVIPTYLIEGAGYRIEPGQWDDSGAYRNPYLCEWGEYTPAYAEIPDGPIRQTSDERDVVLVLDVSGSMGGTPISETKKAAAGFVRSVLQEDASVGIVTYSSAASLVSDFSMDEAFLTGQIDRIGTYGNTNIDSGLQMARELLDYSNGRKKLIILMSDGEPNEGRVGDSLISCAEEIKESGILIYTLGFFGDLGSKTAAQQLMEALASEGCHYEIASADDLVFFFQDVADQITGQKYVYIRIACPVDVSISYGGETLDSSSENLRTRTSFGTLSFEEGGDSSEGGDDRVKVVRLKEGPDYQVHLNGTGRGRMNYTIGFMNEEGEYQDLRRFRSIPVTRKTRIDTVAARTDTTVLDVDEDGDGRYDVKYRAKENGRGELVNYTWILYAAAAAGGGLALALALVLIIRRRRRRKAR